jgi:NAD(P)-dependent dehydrogenase (short-subunit alcohol dehydrogenase family)
VSEKGEQVGLLDGKVVVSIGGGSGIGRAALERFVAEGARVGVLEKYPEKVEELREALGPSAVVVEGDARSFDDNEQIVRAAVAKFGGVDVLTCFAAVHDAFMGVVDLPSEHLVSAFNEIFELNVASCLLATKAALDELVKSRGSIVLSVSHAGFFAGGGGVLYTASKWAVRGLVIQLAHELAPKVRVNGVAPGGALTDLRGLSTLEQGPLFVGLEPDDVRGAMEAITPLPYEPVGASHVGPYLFLACDALSPAVTGVVLPSDGGSAVRGFNRVAGGARSMVASAGSA